jgi:hypothetical protein
MIAPRLQKILDNTSHPRAKELLQDLFENDDFKRSMCQRLEQIICEQRARLGYDMQAGAGAWIWDEDEELNELGPDILNRYIDKASRQVRKGKYGSGTIKSQVKNRTNRVQGIKKANSRLSHFNNDEYSNTTNEGIGSALGHLVKNIATQTVANATGINPSAIHNIVHHLTAKHKPVKHVSAQKPHQPPKPAKPAGASLHTSPIHRTITPGEVHSAIAKYPGEHEDHLNAFINHHNRAMDLKAKGDKSGAAVQFRARNHALVRYLQTAPKAHLKHLNAAKVQQMMAIKAY